MTAGRPGRRRRAATTAAAERQRARHARDARRVEHDLVGPRPQAKRLARSRGSKPSPTSNAAERRLRRPRSTSSTRSPVVAGPAIGASISFGFAGGGDAHVAVDRRARTPPRQRLAPSGQTAERRRAECRRDNRRQAAAALAAPTARGRPRCAASSGEQPLAVPPRRSWGHGLHGDRAARRARALASLLEALGEALPACLLRLDGWCCHPRRDALRCPAAARATPRPLAGHGSASPSRSRVVARAAFAAGASCLAVSARACRWWRPGAAQTRAESRARTDRAAGGTLRKWSDGGRAIDPLGEGRFGPRKLLARWNDIAATHKGASTPSSARKPGPRVCASS